MLFFGKRPLATIMLTAIVLLPGALSFADEKQPQADTILVLDASGSMWGQIDGVNKIVIAKDVVEGLVRSLPAEQRLGLVAYGHRRKSDCGDIETLADVGAERDKTIQKIRDLLPKGRTPLARSVEHAATELNYLKNAATVILVSDGLETCDADPCALAKTLEENGLDFTVHVIGFDVTKEERSGLVCIAEETGGEFLTADNADELADALTQVVAGEGDRSDEGAEPMPATVHLKATILSGGPQIQSDLSWSIAPVGGEALFIARNTGFADTQVPPGDYIAKATWGGWREGEDGGGTEKTGSVEFSVKAQQTKVVTVPIDLGIPVSLDAPTETPEGVGFEVTWSGPDSLGAYVYVSGVDDGPRDAIYFFGTQQARDAYDKSGAALDTNGDNRFDQDDLAKAVLGAPSHAGEYEIRYVLARPRLILARRPLTVTDNSYELRAPVKVAASSAVAIQWSGPLTDGDFVTLIEAGAQDAFRNGTTARLVEGKSATLTAPAIPGSYEIRYILANGYTTYADTQYAVQASIPIEVVDVSAAVTAPASAVGGSTINVDWNGPKDDARDDILSVVQRGAEKRNRDSWVSTVSGGVPSNPAALRVPALQGEYDVVYILNPGARVIARQPITITRAKASVSAPATVAVNQAFEVGYSGDAFKGDRIIFAPADTPDEKMWGWTVNYGFWATADRTVGTIAARLVTAPGDYELRYVSGLQHQVLARTKVVVTP